MSVTFLTNEDQNILEDQIAKVSNELSVISNLSDTECVMNVTGWTSGRIDSGTHAANKTMAYSDILSNEGQAFSFDAERFNALIITYDADGNKKWSSSWLTESPAVYTGTQPYVRVQVKQLSGNLTDDELANLPNDITYTQRETMPIVKTVREVDAKTGTRYVDASTGNDSNPGTVDAPFATINAGVNSGAKLLYVAPGEYNERVLIENRDELTIMPTTYPSSYDASNPDTPMIHITGGNERNITHAMKIIDCGKISITGVWGDCTINEIFLIKRVRDITLTGCYASNNNKDGSGVAGFKFTSTNAVVRRCKAWNVGKDGFGASRYGDIRLYDCIAYDCADDGVSHHDSCTGAIIGGEFYRCGKGGVSSPTYGANVDIIGVYSHDNVYGLYAMNDADRQMSVSRISGCAFVNNTTADLRIGANCTITGWQNVYNTTSIMDEAVYVTLT